MLPFSKKNSEKAKALQAPAWHTNFRNYAVLPDTKLVRTSFFINGLLVLIAIGSVLTFVFQEYKLSVLQKQTREWEQQVDKARLASDQGVALFKKYKAEELKVNELDSFLKGQKIVFSDFIIRLSRTKPQGIVFVSVEYKDSGASIRGYAQGASEQATGAASAYEKQLKDDPLINSVFKSISMTNVSRDVQAGRLSFDIVLLFNQAKSR
jgi:hypothetical protein